MTGEDLVPKAAADVDVERGMTDPVPVAALLRRALWPVGWRHLVVVMGVSGCGKTTVGTLLADYIAAPFVDGDDLHPAANVAKMSAGHPLDDTDRWPWLARVGSELARASSTGTVIACSALKRRYRDLIRSHAPEVIFVHLTAPKETLAARMVTRPGHFMPAALLDSQFADLQPPDADENCVRVDVAGPLPPS